MKASYKTILVLAIAALLAVTLPCGAAEEEESIWSEDTGKRFELTEEKIEHMMNYLSENEPEKAEELKQLREKDAEEFKVELRKVMRQQFGKRFKKRMSERSERSMRRHGRSGPEGRTSHEMGVPWRHKKYLEWLKENYSEEAKKLDELNERNPDLYWKQFKLSLKKYGRIAEAARENPKLAEVLKEDLVLRQQQEQLLGEIETAGDKEKGELIKDLKEVINNRFDVIVERKQIEYEQLLKKLERLKNEVEQRKAKMEKWKDAKFKDESVKARLDELLGKSDKFTW